MEVRFRADRRQQRSIALFSLLAVVVAIVVFVRPDRVGPLMSTLGEVGLRLLAIALAVLFVGTLASALYQLGSGKAVLVADLSGIDVFKGWRRKRIAWNEIAAINVADPETPAGTQQARELTVLLRFGKATTINALPVDSSWDDAMRNIRSLMRQAGGLGEA